MNRGEVLWRGTISSLSCSLFRFPSLARHLPSLHFFSFPTPLCFPSLTLKISLKCVCAWWKKLSILLSLISSCANVHAHEGEKFFSHSPLSRFLTRTHAYHMQFIHATIWLFMHIMTKHSIVVHVIKLLVYIYHSMKIKVIISKYTLFKDNHK